MVFQVWHPEMSEKLYRRHGQIYVRFAINGTMFMSTRLLQKAANTLKTEMKFEVQVDAEKRVFGLKFGEGGFVVTHVPGVVGMAEFCNKYHPKIRKRLVLKWSEEHTMWVGSLDGRAI